MQIIEGYEMEVSRASWLMGLPRSGFTRRAGRRIERAWNDNGNGQWASPVTGSWDWRF